MGVQHCDAFTHNGVQRTPVGKNASRRYTYTLVIVIIIVILIISSIKTIEYKYKNRKRPADDRTDGQTDILYWHSGDLNPWPAAACDA